METPTGPGVAVTTMGGGGVLGLALLQAVITPKRPKLRVRRNKDRVRFIGNDFT
jgi:hypothetical protein